MYITGNPITISWIVGKTSKTIPSSTFDITLHDPNSAVIYTDDAPLTYLAPTATKTGLITYVCPASNPGVWRVLLSTGKSDDYILLDTVRLSVQDNPAEFETRLIALPIQAPTTGALGVVVQGMFGPELGLGALATNNSIIMIAGHQAAGGLGFWITDMNFQNPVFTAFDPDTGLNSWTGLGYGNGVWFISALFGRTWWSDDDGVSWTESIFPVGTGARVSGGGNFYSKNLNIHYNLYGDAHYSIDNCVNFKAQNDVPSGGQELVPSSNLYNYSENPFGNINLIFGGGQERVHHTTTEAQVSNNWSTQIIDFSPSIYNIQHTVGVHNGVLRFAGINSPFHQLKSLDGFAWVDEEFAGDLAGVTTNGLSFIRYLPLFKEFWANAQTGPDEWYKSIDGFTYNLDPNHPFLGDIHRTDSWDPNTILDLPGDGIAVIGVGVNVGGLQFYISHYTRADI